MTTFEAVCEGRRAFYGVRMHQHYSLRVPDDPTQEYVKGKRRPMHEEDATYEAFTLGREWADIQPPRYLCEKLNARWPSMCHWPVQHEGVVDKKGRESAGRGVEEFGGCRAS